MDYHLRKVAFYLAALWAAVTLNFVIPRLLPGDPVDILMAKLQQRGGSVDPAARKAYETLLGTGGRDELFARSTWRTWATCCAVISGCRSARSRRRSPT